MVTFGLAVVTLSPTIARALFFPFPGVYSALLQKMRRCFHCILQRGYKAISPRDLASGYSRPSLATTMVVNKTKQKQKKQTKTK